MLAPGAHSGRTPSAHYIPNRGASRCQVKILPRSGRGTAVSAVEGQAALSPRRRGSSSPARVSACGNGELGLVPLQGIGMLL